LRFGEIEREALFVAVFEDPSVIVLARGIAGDLRQRTIRVAAPGRLDLDDIGTEIREHRRGRGGRDEARAVDHL